MCCLRSFGECLRGMPAFGMREAAGYDELVAANVGGAAISIGRFQMEPSSRLACRVSVPRYPGTLLWNDVR